MRSRVRYSGEAPQGWCITCPCGNPMCRVCKHIRGWRFDNASDANDTARLHYYAWHTDQPGLSRDTSFDTKRNHNHVKDH